MDEHFQASRSFKDQELKKMPDSDIIVTEIAYEDEYLEDGTMIRKRVEHKTNISKQQRETSQLVKIENLNEVIEEIKKEKKE